MAQLATQHVDAADCNRLEWGLTSGRVTLLQLQRTPATRSGKAAAGLPALWTAAALCMASCAHRWPGPPAEDHVLPWAVAFAELADVTADPSSQPLQDWRRAPTLTEDLIRQARSSADEAQHTLKDLRGANPGAALARFETLAMPERADAEKALQLLVGIPSGSRAGSPSCTPSSAPTARR